MIKTSDLKLKEVINISDGRKLGHITDIEIDIVQGQLTAIVVPGAARFLGFLSRNEDVVIPWEQINKIGYDVILVEIGHRPEIKKIEA